MDANIVTTQLSATAVLVWAIQRLKSASWFPWLQESGQVLVKRTASILGALAIHGGVTYVWNPTYDANGYRHLDLAIPTLAVFVVGMWHWTAQYVMQESWYQLIFNRLHLGELGAPVPAGSILTPEATLVIPPAPVQAKS